MDKKEITISYAIKAIKEVALKYKEPYDLLKEHGGDFDSFVNHIQVGLNVHYIWDLKKNSFGVILDYYYRYIKDSQNIELLHFTNISDFYVLKLSDILKDEGNGLFKMDVTWETTFVSIAISSGRGMLASRMAGTFFGTLCFPIVNPKDYIVTNRYNKAEKIIEKNKK